MSIGDPVPRPDGPAKVTSHAKYAADSGPRHPAPVCVGAPIPAGRVASIDIASALAAPGGCASSRIATCHDSPARRSCRSLP